MALPKRKTSHSKKKMRQSHDKLATVSFTPCANCKELILPHKVCPKCGHYKGLEIIKTKDD